MKTLCRSLVISLMACAAVGVQAANRYVARNGQEPLSPYTNAANAASNIQDAVNAAAIADTVWVGAGRYTVPPNATNYVGTNVVFIGKPMALRSVSGNPADVVIDGEGANRGIVCSYNSPNANLFVLDGLTISNCVATNKGGGVLFAPNSWTGVVQNCILANNTVNGESSNVAQGGGLHAAASSGLFSLTLSNCIFRGNRAWTSVSPTNGMGGGAYLGVTFPGFSTVVDCLIESNRAAAGGGFFLPATTATNAIERCTFRGNIAEHNADAAHAGGALILYGGKARLQNCLLVFNASPTIGGGVNVQGNGPGQLFLVNCTVTSNIFTGVSSSSSGAGVCTRRANDTLQIVNSIVYDNIAPGAKNPDIYLGAVPTTPTFFTNSCIGSTNGLVSYSGIVTNPPLFAGATGLNFRLTASSPCLNKGLWQSWMEGAVDLDGARRVDRKTGLVDLGAYEYPLYPSGALVIFR